MIRPTGRALGAAAAMLPLAALPTVLGDEAWWPLWAVALGAFAGAMLVDFALLPTLRALSVAAAAPAQIEVGDPAVVTLTGTGTRQALVHVLIDASGPIEPLPPAALAIAPGEPAVVDVPLLAQRRGIVLLRHLHLQWRGPLGLLQCTHDVAMRLETAVLPNVTGARQRALRMLNQREFQSGQRIERYIGDGSEFEALREFVLGMDRRSVDWKASARHRQLLCREFRAERNHSVVLCIDTGRLMREPLHDLPRLDHAIHSALQLGYVCLRTGDRVGLHAFAAAPQHFVAPQAGVHVLHAIQQTMAGLDYGEHESNFTHGMTDLLRRLRRRSLVVLFTDFVDSVTAELMVANVSWLARRHLLLFVAMRDPLLDDYTRKVPADDLDLHRAVIAGDMRRERQLVLSRIRQAGAQVIDATVGELAPSLIDRYLMVKRRELV